MKWLIMCALGMAAFSGGTGRAGEVRQAAVAGQFYERMPAALEARVDRLLKEAAHPATTGRLVAAVVPHAGYVFSGPCAAAAYSAIAGGGYARVIILAPSHYARIPGVSLPSPDLSAYETPLGRVEIDRQACDALREVKGFVSVPGADAREHAVEVQLPLLQKTAVTFKLVPLLCGQLTAAQLDSVAKALAPYVSTGTLLLASSDFTHYGPNYDFVPFRDDVPGHLRGWLSRAAEAVARLDRAGFAGHCQETGDTICGATPIRIMMSALAESKAAVRGQVMALALSGDLTGDYDNSVSYAAIGFFSGESAAGVAGTRVEQSKEGHAVKEKRSGTWTPGLTADEKRTLFAIARDTLKWCVGGKKGKFRFDSYTITPIMETNTATFVTLKIGGHLRGCIGSLAPVEPLYLSVHGNAINAASRDPRFMPVTERELADIEVDVSILSPVRDIGSLAEFKVGQHGIILEKGMHRAVYLPEVAVEQGWGLDETLSSLSLKAGLGPEAWREGARFKVFESVVLSE